MMGHPETKTYIIVEMELDEAKTVRDYIAHRPEPGSAIPIPVREMFCILTDLIADH